MAQTISISFAEFFTAFRWCPGLYGPL